MIFLTTGTPDHSAANYIIPGVPKYDAGGREPWSSG